MSVCVEQSGGRVILRVYVQPKASCEAIVGYHDKAVKIKLKAPPVGGQANAACIRFLSSLVGLRRTSLSIVSGQKSRAKTVEIEGRSADEVLRIIAAHLPQENTP